ncbi:SMP-30/gluconolactonase/LRE family protein [Hydrogenovibrio kuenenii]|uniref:SMP-30/gluconolactonase/LRE family protein n=1 Tax=Hydrogenovibrio kuenenii TaxID=63658 RepID=UPI000467E4CA|nr:SMP-30/gluconolactonase/LRE family protein [Hydrogenovibrio kuenenii]
MSVKVFNKKKVFATLGFLFAGTVLLSSVLTTASAADIVVKDVGFQTPESVEYNPQGDSYLVSNINGSPFDKDNNGFISKLSPEGKVLDLKWIAGGKKGVTLNAPKGMVADGNTLYVADIDTIRTFNLTTGKPIANYPIAGSSFLNGMTPSSKGGVWVTDSGVAPGFKPAGTDAIYHVSAKRKIKTLTKGKDLGRPNGILEKDGQLIVVTIASGQVHHFDLNGEWLGAEAFPYNKLDGLIMDNKGNVIFSSWKAQAIKEIQPDANPKTLFTGLKSPADLGYDTKRNRLLIPSFLTNKVWIKSLPTD